MDRRRLLQSLPAAVAISGSAVLHAESTRTSRIGYLTSGKPGGAFDTFRVFREGFLRLGYTEGRDVTFEVRYGAGAMDALVPLAAELVQLDCHVIACSSAVALRALRQAGARMPLVFAVVPSPQAVVEMGFASSIEHPGGNITGFSSFDPNQASKSFQLLKDILPNLRSVGILSDQDIPHAANDPEWNPLERAYDRAARAAGLTPLVLRIKGPSPDLLAAFDIMAKEKVQALRVLEVPVPLLNLDRIGALARQQRLPAMLPGGYPNSGGLISYGTSIFDAVREAPGYVDKILKGAKPDDLPIKTSAEGELVINLTTAREIGVQVPDSVIRRASRTL